LAAAAGAARLQVRRKPRISVFAIGDELVAPGRAPAPAQIFDSAGFGAAALAEAWGALAKRRPLLSDDPDRITSAVGDAIEHSDAIVMIGGASVGLHDHARGALQALGFDGRFTSVAVKPGKPTWFGYCRDRPVLGLPGNPASALVCARLFLCPLIEGMLGRNGQDPLMTHTAFVAESIHGGGGREEYLRAAVTQRRNGLLCLKQAGDQDSSLTSSLAASNALIQRPAHARAAAAGDAVAFLYWLRRDAGA
ncbi:MAG TPA: molybdopterin molybdenumtransferase MoeA, partial [Hyphomonadaceae bacterium]|nr:molybdopterin molybdenumtransferase MoeA [Hyphomonadaceae bacterium]